jgi:hypothetical protein
MQGYDPSANPLNGNEWSFPLIEIVHIASFAMSVGTIAIVDLRLLGLAMRRWTSLELLQATELWTQFGILLAVFSGMLLFTTDPESYLRNAAFQFKMACLLAAIIFNYTAHRKVASSKHSVFAGRAVGAVSIALWLMVVFSGIFYGFI